MSTGSDFADSRFAPASGFAAVGATRLSGHPAPKVDMFMPQGLFLGCRRNSDGGLRVILEDVRDRRQLETSDETNLTVRWNRAPRWLDCLPTLFTTRPRTGSHVERSKPVNAGCTPCVLRGLNSGTEAILRHHVRFEPSGIEAIPQSAQKRSRPAEPPSGARAALTAASTPR